MERNCRSLRWGNGACVNNGSSYKNLLTEIASHGFLAIAIGPPRLAEPAGNPGAQPKGRGIGNPGRGGPATKSSQLIDAVNWATPAAAFRPWRWLKILA
jgi:hypothetical protein